MCCICQFLKLNLRSILNPCLFKECFYNILNIISNYIREIKHKSILKIWIFHTEFLFNSNLKGVTHLPGSSASPEQVIWQGTPNSHQPDETANRRNFHKSSLAVFHWKCSHPRSLPFRNLSLTNWHSLLFGVFSPHQKLLSSL